MKARIIREDCWQDMARNIIFSIIVEAKKGYGVKFISRETGEEVEDTSAVGLFLMPVQRAMEQADSD